MSGSESGEGPPPSERRVKSRSRALLGAIAIFANGQYSFDCMIRSLSQSGARVSIPKTAQFPSRFYLINIRDQLVYDANLTWHSGAEIGVEFINVTSLTDITDPALGYLRRAWLERAPR